MVEELKTLKKRLDPRDEEELGGVNAFLGFLGGSRRTRDADGAQRDENPNPGLAMRWLRQADHDVAAAENDVQPTREVLRH